MVLSAEQERVRSLIADTVSLLCKNGLHYTKEFSIEGLLGITLDHDEVFLVNIKEIVKTEMSKDYLESGSGSEESTNPNPSSRRRRRKRQRKNTGDGVESDSDNEMNSSVHGGRDNSSKKNIKLEDNDSGDDLVFVKNEPGLNHSNNFSSNFSGLSGATSATNDILGDLSQQGQLYATPTSNPLPSPSWDPHHSTNSLYNTPNHQQAMNVMSPTASPGGSMQHMGQQQHSHQRGPKSNQSWTIPASPNSSKTQLQSIKLRTNTTPTKWTNWPHGSLSINNPDDIINQSSPSIRIPAEYQLYECETCCKTFKSRQGLKYHEDQHRGVFPYHCPYCNRGLLATTHVRVHLETHTGVPGFVCVKCLQGYSTFRNLKEHLDKGCSGPGQDLVTVRAKAQQEGRAAARFGVQSPPPGNPQDDSQSTLLLTVSEEPFGTDNADSEEELGIQDGQSERDTKL